MPAPTARRPGRRARHLAVPGALALALACATNPVTGKKQLAFISEKDEIALGQQSAAQVKEQMGEYPDKKLQEYVSGVGLELAKKSERPNLPWSFTVIDDPTVNAFALPGGPIFVTRGLLTHMTSEAELAGVLGHEIGHVTARHSVEQLSKAQLAQLGLGLGMVLSESVRNVGQAAMAGLQLLFLKYGRDDERQADQLGFKYMVGDGYDPRQMAEMFDTLRRSSAASGAGRVPEWASTHPDPGDRAAKARERASKLEGDPSRLKVRREEFVSHLEGMTFGEDPRQGYMEGSSFVHPGLKFRLDLPEGWKSQNLPQALMAVSPGQDAAFQLTVAGKMSPEEASRKFFAQEGVQPAKLAGASPPPNGGYFQAQTQQGALGGLVTFVSHEGMTFMLLGYAPAEKLPAADPAFRKTMASFRTLTDPAALGVQPAKVALVKLPRDMTVSQFAVQYPSTAPPEVLAIINGVEGDEAMKAGTTAKRVVGGMPTPARAAR